uniref:Uncharacterized protein n=1 Tax=Ciona savignyi TaxID=51511 RepID=H2YI51_CIOSA
FVKVKPLPQNRSQSTASKQKAYKPIGQFQPPKPNLHKQISNLHRAVADNDVNMVSYMCGWGASVTSNQSCDPLCQCI